MTAEELIGREFIHGTGHFIILDIKDGNFKVKNASGLNDPFHLNIPAVIKLMEDGIYILKPGLLSSSPIYEIY